MAKKLSPKQFQRLLKKDVGKQIDKLGTSSFKKLGEFAANLIKKRTRLGFGTEGHDKEKSELNKLKSKQYIAFRKRLFKGKVQFRKSENKITFAKGKTTPAKSNLTLTGGMLDNHTSWQRKKWKVTIGFIEKRAKRLAGYHHDKQNKNRRPFNYLTKSEKRQIFQEIKTRLKKGFRSKL